ncbi:MAG: hypothetical protein H8E73_02930 [Planctomycetes bacterium]|nr:hypothetical protein [Planctomycetota bacterium]
MWLPIDERHLLLGYYVNIFNIDDKNVCRYLDSPKWFEMSDWTTILAKPNWIPMLTPWLVKHAARNVKAYGGSDKAPTSKNKGVDEFLEEVKIHIKLDRRLQFSNSGLEKRKLISVQRHQRCDEVAGISLTIEGCDLGRKNSSWWARGGLFFAE